MVLRLFYIIVTIILLTLEVRAQSRTEIESKTQSQTKPQPQSQPTTQSQPQANPQSQALNRRGVELLDSMQYKMASKVFSQAIELHGGKAPNLDYANSLAGLAKSVSFFKLEIADSLYTKSIEIQKSLNSDKSEVYAQTLQDLGQLRVTRQHFETVEAIFNKVLELRRDIFGSKSIEYAQTLGWLGLYYAYKSDFKKSEKYFLDALGRATKAGYTSDYKFGELLILTSYLYYFKEDFITAKSYCEEAIEIFMKKRDPYDRNLIDSYACLAIIYHSLARTSEATELLELLMDSSVKRYGKEDYFYISALPSLGAMYVQSGRMQEAIPILEESMGLAEKMYGEHNDAYYTALNSLATIYWQTNDYRQAEALFIRSLELREQAGGEYSVSYIRALNNLANLYRSMGDNTRAIKHLERTAELSGVVLGEESDSNIMALTNLAFIYLGMGSVDESLALYDRITAILKRAKMASEPRFMRIYALKFLTFPAEYLSIPEIEESYTSVTETIKICFGEHDPVYINLISHLADCYYHNNDYQKAQIYVSQLLGVLRRQGQTLTQTYSIALMNAGKISLSMSRLEEAEGYLESYLSVMRRLSEQNFAFMSTNQRELYWSSIKSSINYISDATAFLLSNDYDPTSLSQLMGLCYNSVLFTKSLMLNSSIEIQKSVLQSNDRELVGLWQQLKSLRSYPDANAEQIEMLDKQLALRWLAFDRQQKDFSIIWQDVRARLAPKEAAIEFIPVKIDENSSKISYVALVLRSSSVHPQMVVLADEDVIIEESKRSQNGGESLYEELFLPIEPYLDGVQTIYISTSGLLCAVSFAGMEISDGYLCDRYEIVNLLSTKDLLRIKTQPKISERKDIALFAGADFGLLAADLNRPDTVEHSSVLRGLIDEFDNTRGQGFDYLPNSKREVVSIGEILAKWGWQTKIYLDKDATEAHFKSLSSDSPAVLHISTHGYYFPPLPQDGAQQITVADPANRFKLSDNPLMRSGLLFSGANRFWNGERVEQGDDGVLTAYEICDLDLGEVELAVLSACNTGVGDVDYGEGVYGLQRAFRLAGVRSMIVALWPIPDKETVEFMEEFYRQWGGSGDVKGAFIIAQKRMRVLYPANPEIWAGFVLIN